MAPPLLSIPTPKLHADWQKWIRECLAGRTPSIEIYNTMRRKGFGQGQLREALGKAYPKLVPTPDGTDGSGRIVDYGLVAHCALTRRTDPNLRRVPTKKAQIYVWSDFLSAAECGELRRLTDTRLLDSTISANDDPQYAAFRTSRTCLLDELGSPLADAVGDRISRSLGLSQSWSEPNQAQKYETGQEFKAHTDYFEPGAEEYDSHCKTLGQRTWTFMIYLNDVPEGGATRFRKLEKVFRPKQGQAVIWNSLTPDGDPNPWTLHHGMKVRSGEKYVITKWFRDRGTGPMVREE